ncbi:MAG: hypothetical protein OXG19_01685 [Chloroflexi bacterium]|nr:hypothetical protein [Chloroflexota bacterium]
MTPEEHLRDVADLLREYAEVRKEIACLATRLHKAGRYLKMLSQWLEDDPGSLTCSKGRIEHQASRQDVPHAHSAGADIAGLLDRFFTARKEEQRLYQALKVACDGDVIQGPLDTRNPSRPTSASS